MEISLIEKFDKSRYILLKWSTIGFISWYGTFTVMGTEAKELMNNNKLIIGLMLIINFIGWVFWTISLIKTIRLSKKINADSKLKEALNNELYRYYDTKSFVAGYWALAVTICAFSVITRFYDISASVVCQLCIFIGVASLLIARLIYYK